MSTVSQSPLMSGLSALFSLSDAAATVPPMPVATGEQAKTTKDSKDLASGKNGSHAPKHRRLSSTGQTRRRMSDARDAVSRPAPASLSAASALASLSSLSLTPSGITSNGHNLHSHSQQTRGRSQANISQGTFAPSSAGSNGAGALAASAPETSYVQDMAFNVADDIEVDVEDFDDGASVAESVATRTTDKKSGKAVKVKKRGTIFQCESCSKRYRHPACLIKHRWEHIPQWREASKFMLSKHQQVQVLEAAAILYTGSSLPEDKSYWPAFVSNGLVPPPSAENAQGMEGHSSVTGARSSGKISSSFIGTHHPVSSSVPVRTPVHTQAPLLDRTRSGSVTSTASGGPRMHDFTVQGGITQIRPGLLAQPTTSTAPTRHIGGTVSPYVDEELDMNEEKDNSDTQAHMQVVSPSKPQPMSVPQNSTSNSRGNFVTYRDGGSMLSASGFSVESGSVSASLAHSGGWSLPRSDMRSSSVARSYSGSRSDDEEDAPHSARGGSEDDVDLDVDVADAHRDRFDGDTSYGSYSGPGFGFANRRSKEPAIKEEADDSWEDMDMEL